MNDFLDRGGSERADQLVLQVGVADVEPERLHIRAIEVRAEPRSFQAAPEVALFARVAQPGDALAWRDRTQRAADRLSTADRTIVTPSPDNVPPQPPCERPSATLSLMPSTSTTVVCCDTQRVYVRALARLREPEVVAGRVAEAGVDAVRLLRRLLRELDAAALQLLVRPLAVVGREEEPAGGAPRDQVWSCRRVSSSKTGGPGMAISAIATSAGRARRRSASGSCPSRAR